MINQKSYTDNQAEINETRAKLDKLLEVRKNNLVAIQELIREGDYTPEEIFGKTAKARLPKIKGGKPAVRVATVKRTKSGYYNFIDTMEVGESRTIKNQSVTMTKVGNVLYLKKKNSDKKFSKALLPSGGIKITRTA